MNKRIIIIFFGIVFLIGVLFFILRFFLDEVEIAKLNLKYYNYDLAIKRLNKVLTKMPNNPEARLYLGLCYLRKGNDESAFKEFDWLEENFPNFNFPAFIHNEIGLAYYTKGRYQEAIEEFDKAVRLNPNYSEAYFNLGVAYSALGEIKKAISAYRNVIRLNPKNIYAHWNLAVNLEMIGDWQGAIYHWKNYIQYTPGVFRHSGVEEHLKELEKRILKE
ncbi:MAG: tetratricopeptide repeat protein [Candidatus Omnitrophica bacterium]|nr:tetratricopeptide repeat protein [Candidatus Omnitrophota bacterium]